MKSSGLLCVGLLWIPLVVVCGCGREEKAPVVKQQPKTVEKIEVAELDEPIGPLDQGRIEVAPPADWYVAPRSSKWIVRFQMEQWLSYPSIFVTAEDYESVSNLTRSNVEEFARQIAQAIEADAKIAKLSRPIKPIDVGDLVAITYARRAKVKHQDKTVIVERLFVDTVVEGRKYNFELRARKGTLDRYRPHLMAVASGMKYVATGGEEPPEETPGVEAPGGEDSGPMSE